MDTDRSSSKSPKFNGSSKKERKREKSFIKNEEIKKEKEYERYRRWKGKEEEQKAMQDDHIRN